MEAKYKDAIPLDNWESRLYMKPDPEVIELVKKKRQRRKVFRVEINTDKKKLQQKLTDKKEPMANEYNYNER
jgi:hypothetical protein